MRFTLILALLLIELPALASQPTGKTFGAWRVSSISSLSGDAGNDDASVVMAQGDEPDVLQVYWLQGSPVVVSINIEKCSGEQDYEASYAVEPARWLRLSAREARERLQADLDTWLAQAQLACRPGTKVGKFKQAGLKDAVADFTTRLRFWATED